MADSLSDSRQDALADQPNSSAEFRGPSALDILLRSRPALGFGPAAAPAVLFLPLGFLLGPSATNVLSETVLAHLDAVVSVALAAIGVFVGLGLDLRRSSDVRLLGAASAEAAVTIMTVLLAGIYLLAAWDIPLDLSIATVAMALGVCASASTGGRVEQTRNPVQQLAARIASLDDVLPIIVGGLLLAGLRTPTVGAALQFGVLTVAIGVGIALTGWLLFEWAHGEAERGVFVLGTLLLLGGSAAYLSLSPLLAGMSAGIFWAVGPGGADRIIRQDLKRLQHPLVVLLLLAAGAGVAVTLRAVWLLVPYVLFRLAGKLAGGWLASRLSSGIAPADLGAYLIQPGVLGVAFALNLQQVVASTTGADLVSAVALGALASEVLALLAWPGTSRT